MNHLNVRRLTMARKRGVAGAKALGACANALEGLSSRIRSAVIASLMAAHVIDLEPELRPAMIRQLMEDFWEACAGLEKTERERQQ